MFTVYIPANITGHSFCALFWFACFYSWVGFVLVFCFLGFGSTGNYFLCCKVIIVFLDLQFNKIAGVI